MNTYWLNCSGFPGNKSEWSHFSSAWLPGHTPMSLLVCIKAQDPLTTAVGNLSCSHREFYFLASKSLTVKNSCAFMMKGKFCALMNDGGQFLKEDYELLLYSIHFSNNICFWANRLTQIMPKNWITRKTRRQVKRKGSSSPIRKGKLNLSFYYS